MSTARNELLQALQSIFAGGKQFEGEKQFQAALAKELGSVERGLPATFNAPRHPAKRPPESAIKQFAEENPGKELPPEGKDPCAKKAKIDMVWSRGSDAIALEWKYVTKWQSDTYGYEFLKHLHRLERLAAAGDHNRLASQRFAGFVTTEEVYWIGKRPEPKPFWLTDGRRIERKYWVQYDQKSPNTLWYKYPPFYLANAYEFRWEDLGRAGRCLMVEVAPQ